MEHPCKYIVVRESHLSQMNLGKCEDYLGLRKPERHHIDPNQMVWFNQSQIVLLCESQNLGHSSSCTGLSIPILILGPKIQIRSVS